MSIRKGNNIIAGNPSIETVANVDLSNLSSNGKHYIAFKGYDSTTSYSLNDVVVSIQNNEVKIYQSLADNNTSSLSDTTKWKEVELGGSIAIDGNTVTFNSNDEIQTIGVIDSSNNTIALKLWTGTRAEYDAITTKDSNTLYHIKDDTGELVTFANADLSNLSSTGEAHFANPDLSNLSAAGQAKFDAKANVSNTVTTDTAQTISGVKTFTANTIVNGGAGNGTFTIKNDVTDYGTSAVDLVVATGNGKNQFLVHFQEGNKWCAYFDQNPSTKNVTFSLTPCAAVLVPTPATTANDNQAATTAWVNSKIQLVNELPANPVAGVLYVIPES